MHKLQTKSQDDWPDLSQKSIVGLNINDKRVSNTTRIGNIPDGPTMSLSESPMNEQIAHRLIIVYFKDFDK
jgi:hypothetical protein